MSMEEGRALIKRLREICEQLESDYKAGLVSEEEYQAKWKLVEEAADKMDALSEGKQ